MEGFHRVPSVVGEIAMSRRARAVGVEVKDSVIHGRGVFALERIAKGACVIEYAGERVPANKAYARYGRRGPFHTFLFDLENGFLLDGGVGGNESRFINHSCRRTVRPSSTAGGSSFTRAGRSPPGVSSCSTTASSRTTPTIRRCAPPTRAAAARRPAAARWSPPRDPRVTPLNFRRARRRHEPPASSAGAGPPPYRDRLGRSGEVGGRSLQQRVVPILELAGAIAEAAAVSHEHRLRRGVAVQLPLPPRHGHLPDALRLLHQHEMARGAAARL